MADFCSKTLLLRSYDCNEPDTGSMIRMNKKCNFLAYWSTRQARLPKVHCEMHLQKREFFSLGLLRQPWGFHPPGGGALFDTSSAPENEITKLLIETNSKTNLQFFISYQMKEDFLRAGSCSEFHLEEGHFLTPLPSLRMKSRNC